MTEELINRIVNKFSPSKNELIDVIHDIEMVTRIKCREEFKTLSLLRQKAIIDEKFVDNQK